MKRIKGIIFLLVTLIVVILLLIILLTTLQKQNNQKEQEKHTGDEGIDITQIEAVIEKVTTPNNFFIVENCIQTYINYANSKDAEKVYDVLDLEYINDNNITLENILKYARFEQTDRFKAQKINVITGKSQIEEYSVYGYINNQNRKYLFFKVKLDTKNSTFSIIPYNSEQYTSIEEIALKDNEGSKILKNGNNNYKYINLSTEAISKKYFENLKNNLLYSVENTYNMLDEEYKKERFSNINEFSRYISENQMKIKTSALSRYSYNYKDGYIECVLEDTYENTYILKITAVLEYTIKLDNYTIKNKDYNEKYNSLNDSEKVCANAYEFLQMINTKDYKHAYALLDTQFKNNNFKTIDKFITYAKSNFFDYNLNINNITVEEEGKYFVYKTTIKNSSSSVANSKNLTIIMQLKEGTDFVMSFSIE